LPTYSAHETEAYRCRKCGYIIGYRKAGHCPECGSWFDTADEGTFIRYPEKRIQDIANRIRRQQIIAGAAIGAALFFLGIEYFSGFLFGAAIAIIMLFLVTVEVILLGRCVFGLHYALRHVALLWVFSLVFFSGIFVIPALMKSDIKHLHEKCFIQEDK
jgi:hypothetical protein